MMIPTELKAGKTYKNPPVPENGSKKRLQKIKKRAKIQKETVDARTSALPDK